MIGERLAHYEILAVLGRGAMGEVYRARDTKLGRDVALKIVPKGAKHPELLQRFRREARSLAALDHPNIVAIHSVDEADGHPFLTMGLVEGRSLDGHIPPGGMPRDRWIRTATSIAEGLAAAHGKGVIHRDLKPANIMVTPGGSIKIVDFGVAKYTEDGILGTGCPDATIRGAAVGTIPYMSPEQVLGEAIDARSDVFSLGIVLYEMASGRRPFRGESRALVAQAILTGDVDPLTGPITDAFPAAADIVMRCLEKAPEKRYASVSQVLRDIDTLEGNVELYGSLQDYLLQDAPKDGMMLDDLALPSRPSLVVLPFKNLGDSDDDAHLANGLWFDLHAELVKLSGLMLIGAGSTAAAIGSTTDPRRIGKLLRVRHVLEGGVRRIGDRVRLTVQLIETETGQPVWADRYDSDIDDLFALQDEVNARILAALDVRILHGEGSLISATEFESPRARELFYEALPLVFSPRIDDLMRARRILQQVDELEPGTWMVPGHAGWAHYRETAHCLGPNHQKTLDSASACAELAIARGDPGGLAYMLQATILLWRARFDEARGAADVALHRRPGCPWAYGLLASLLNYVDEPERGVEFAAMSFRLSPLTPHLFPAVMATSYYLMGEHARAITAARCALELDADSLDALVVLAAAHVAGGQPTDAASTADEIRRVCPHFTVDAFARSQPYRNPETRNRIAHHLELAGL